MVNLARTVAGHTTLIPLPEPFTGQPLHALLFADDDQAWVCTGERGVLHYLHGQWQRETRLPEQACSSLAQKTASGISPASSSSIVLA